MNQEAAIAEAESYLSLQRDKMTPAAGVVGLRRIFEGGMASLYDNIAAAAPSARTDEWIANLVSIAKDGGDDAGIRQIAAHMMSKGHELPVSLREYVIEVLRAPTAAKKNPAKPGPDARSLAVRDTVIRQTVAWIARRYDLKPTRNVATDTAASSCSVVSEALSRIGIHLSEGAVAKIWDGRKKS